MPRITSVKALDGYRLAVSFDDGVEGIIEMRDRLFGPVFEPLKDLTQFQQVFIDEFGAIAWPNGADLAPDALHERLSKAPEIVSR